MERFTLNEVKKILLEERIRAVKIAHDAMVRYDIAYSEKETVGDESSFIQNELSDSARIIGNTISGLDALTHVLGKTEESIIDEQLDKYCVEREKRRFRERSKKIKRIIK